MAVKNLANRYLFSPDLLLHFGAHYRDGPGTESAVHHPGLREPVCRVADGDPPASDHRAGGSSGTAGAVGGAGRRGPHGCLARPGLAGAPDRCRVRGGGPRRSSRGAARRRALHPAGRPWLADLSLHTCNARPLVRLASQPVSDPSRRLVESQQVACEGPADIPDAIAPPPTTVEDAVPGRVSADAAGAGDDGFDDAGPLRAPWRATPRRRGRCRWCRGGVPAVQCACSCTCSTAASWTWTCSWGSPPCSCG